MQLEVVTIVDHCQGADIVTYGLRVVGWNAYGPSREVAQRYADLINSEIRYLRPPLGDG